MGQHILACKASDTDKKGLIVESTKGIGLTICREFHTNVRIITAEQLVSLVIFPKKGRFLSERKEKGVAGRVIPKRAVPSLVVVKKTLPLSIRY